MNDMSSERKSQVKSQFNAVSAEYDAGPGCFKYFGKQLVMAAQIETGQRVLDVASGRGAVLFPCAERVGRTGEAIGVDLAEEMVRAMNAEAAERGLRAQAQVMDAEHLDFADSTFDRVLCGFGIMFFPDQLRALGEFRRVLKSGGAIALSTWKISQTSELLATMADMGMHRARQPGWIDESEDLEKLVLTAEFSNVAVRENTHSFRYADVDQYWQQARGTGMRRMLDALTAADAERLRSALTKRVTSQGQGDFYSTSTALIAVASR